MLQTNRTADFAVRLKDAGLWDEAQQFRIEEEIRGATKAQSYRSMLSKFLPRLADDPQDQDGDTPVVIPRKVERLAELAQAARGRTGNEVQCVRWVAENILVNPEEIDPETVPNPMAAAMLEWARGVGTTEFWRIWAKLIPNSKVLEAMDAFSDDGRSVLELIGRVNEATFDGGS